MIHSPIGMALVITVLNNLRHCQLTVINVLMVVRLCVCVRVRVCVCVCVCCCFVFGSFGVFENWFHFCFLKSIIGNN